MKKTDIFMKEECYVIQGAIFDVYKEMGPGFLEKVYQECLEIELSNRGIPYSSQQELSISYKGHPIKQFYIPDLICFNTIIVEIKGVSHITSQHESQMLNYLKATGLHLGLIVNFGSFPKVEIKRMIL